MQIYPPGSLIINRYEVLQAPNPNIEKDNLVGGMGFVYFCYDTKNKHPVALKFIKTEYLNNLTKREYFLREGKAWIDLGRHPNIVRCYDVKYADPTAFLVLELIAKEYWMKDASLRAWMGAPLPVGQSVLFALQIARGMRHATQKIIGLVHRDLKPENVLVGTDKLPGTGINCLHVTDFGLAKIVADEIEDEEISTTDGLKQNQVQFTRNAGTPLYMAPEQWKGESVGTYTDIYALGCILYEMLTGKAAATGSNLIEIRLSHCSGNLLPIPKDLNLPGPVRDFLTRSLAVSAKDRPQMWNEVIATLEVLFTELGVGSVPPESRGEDESVAERRSVASSYNAMGISYAHMGKSQEAFGYFRNALDIFLEIQERQGEGTVSGNMGNVLVQLGESHRSFDYLNKDLMIAREIGDRSREGFALGNMGEMYRRLGDLRRAIELYEERLNIVREIHDRRGEENALGSLGLAYTALGKMETAITCYKKQLAITHEIGDRRGEGNAFCNLGNAYAQLEQSDVAFDYYEQYRIISIEIGDRIGEGNAWGNKGNIYLTKRAFDDAIQCYEMSLEIERGIGNKRGEGNVLGNLAIAYAQQGKVDEARRICEQRLQIARETGDLMGTAVILGNMAKLYEKLGDIPRALKYAQESLNIFKQIGHVRNAEHAQKIYDQIAKNKS